MQGPEDEPRVQDLPQLRNSSEEGTGGSGACGCGGARSGSGGACCGSVISQGVGGWERENLARRLLAGAEARSSRSRTPMRLPLS